MQALKIVITGAYSAGKTNFIRTLSDIDIVSTEYEVTNPEERLLKNETSVALDFGTIAISEDIVLYVFGTPGQERFNFMWEHLSIGCIGYVVLNETRSNAQWHMHITISGRILLLTICRISQSLSQHITRRYASCRRLVRSPRTYRALASLGS